MLQWQTFICGTAVFRHTETCQTKPLKLWCWKLYSKCGFHCTASLSSVWNQVAPLPESRPLHGHTVVQFPPRAGLGGGELSHVGFDWVSCCSRRYKIRLLCELEGAGQTHGVVGMQRNVTYFFVNKLLFVWLVRDNGAQIGCEKTQCLLKTSV